MKTTKITDATSEPVTLADAKRHLKEDLVDAANDAYITSLITVARTACEERLQRTLLPTVWEKTLDAFPGAQLRDTSLAVAIGAIPPRYGCQAILLLRPRVIAITSVKYVDTTGVQQTLDPAQYTLDASAEPGVLVPAYGVSWPATRAQPGAVAVRYSAGYADANAVPLPIKQWILLAIGDLYRNRNRSAETPALPHDFADGLIATYEVTGG
jgi:hypothetical protein